ncbi:uncharacterized protein LOC108914227 [Anoplophora glabripennis]|uniref:uncharacterized protein LOC108914227 n=1 Tax=Anoplophora glabripennis TaxID=217634 RepID=UPI0008745A3A|nr:uncharacterized protein LOC108914227 [Anoplophora glabripennis]
MVMKHHLSEANKGSQKEDALAILLDLDPTNQYYLYIISKSFIRFLRKDLGPPFDTCTEDPKKSKVFVLVKLVGLEMTKIRRKNIFYNSSSRSSRCRSRSSSKSKSGNCTSTSSNSHSSNSHSSSLKAVSARTALVTTSVLLTNPEAE